MPGKFVAVMGTSETHMRPYIAQQSAEISLSDTLTEHCPGAADEHECHVSQPSDEHTGEPAARLQARLWPPESMQD